MLGKLVRTTTETFTHEGVNALKCFQILPIRVHRRFHIRTPSLKLVLLQLNGVGCIV